ncbi:MAG: cation transporter [Treponema sp.]|jgi:copper chaperone CopZ|nr:cation transporter [Treponema sp.]
MKTILKIEGMSCDHCVKHVQEALEGTAGVTSARVRLSDKSAEVEHGAGTTLEALKAAVEEAGYEVVEQCAAHIA